MLYSITIARKVIMPNTKKMIEQRKHKRFYVQNGTYAMLKYKPALMGQITDMSKDGLAIRYIDGEQQLSDSNVLDIFMADSSFYIEKLQVKTISDREVTDQHSFGSNKARQRGVQFEGLNPIQLFQLYYLLQNYTADRSSVKDRRQLDNAPYSGAERRKIIERRKNQIYV
jgi:hypothetical protein